MPWMMSTSKAKIIATIHIDTVKIASAMETKIAITIAMKKKTMSKIIIQKMVGRAGFEPATQEL